MACKHKHPIVFCVISFAITVQNIIAVSWQASGSGDSAQWSLDCDWRGDDIRGVRSNGEECGRKCREQGDCTHFTWTDWEGGTCWLKGGNVCPNDAFDNSGPVCGFLTDRNHGCGQSGGQSGQSGYGQALELSQKFYEANRCGPLPHDNRIPWRKSSFLSDGQDVGRDLAGGYFDAGDYVKFGFPMAYSMTVLAMGMIDFVSGYQKSGQTAIGVKTLKWGTDYFIKCHTAPNELYGQVGNGGVDHAYWGRPEDWGNRERPSYKIDAGRPGSDLAAETAAALAASSIVFRANGDPGYADECLRHATQLYDFANKHRGKYSDSITDARSFYQSWSGFEDELVWAAAWLHRATNDGHFLSEATNKWNEFGFDGRSPDQFSWDDKSAGVFALMFRITKDNRYGNKLREVCDRFASQTRRTPGGLVWITEWGPSRHAANAAFILLQGDSLGLGGGSYRSLAQQQIDYLLGKNPLGMSYMIGYTNNHARKPHHRSSSCPTVESCGGCVCDWSHFNSPDPNPNVLEGALVGGPDSNDQFADRRDDYVRNEVATDYNAALQGALAALI